MGHGERIREEGTMSDDPIGKVTHYFDRIGVAVLQLTGTIRVGDTLHFHGHSTDFKQKVDSLQLEHVSVPEGNPGQDVALKVSQKVHPNDQVTKVTE
jgi:translation elongation factor EF-1alpha